MSVWMKRAGSYVGAVAASVLFAFAAAFSGAGGAWAEGNSFQGDAPDGWEPTVNIDHEVNSDGVVNATVTLRNNFIVPMKDLRLQLDTPQGLQPQGDTEVTVSDLPVGEVAHLTVKLAPGETPADLASTGANVLPYAVIAALLLLGGGLVAARGRISSHKKTAALASLLAVALGVSALPGAAPRALADELNISTSAEQTVRVGEKEYTLHATAQIGNFDVPSVPRTAKLEVRDLLNPQAQFDNTGAVATGATKAHLFIYSDIDFAPSINSSAILLNEGFRGLRVENVKVRSANTVEITLDGALPAERSIGVLSLQPEAFAGSDATGYVMVNILSPEATIADTSHELSPLTYKAGTYEIPIGLGSAEAGETVTVTPHVPVEGVSFTVKSALGDHSILVTSVFEEGERSAEETFALLNNILTGGLDIAGTNAGTLYAQDKEVRNKSEVNALSEADSRFHLLLTSVQAEKTDAGVDLDYGIEIQPTEGSHTIFDQLETGTAVTVKPPLNKHSQTVAVVRENGKNPHIHFVLSLTNSEASALSLPADGVATGAAVPLSEDLEKRFAEIGQATEITLSNRTITNRIGIAQEIKNPRPVRLSERYFVPSYDDDGGTSEILNGMSEVIEVISAIASGISEEHPFEVLGGVAGLIGIIGDIMEDQSVTLKTLDEKLDRVNATVDRIETDVENISKQIEKFSDQRAYLEKIEAVYSSVQKVMNLRPVFQQTLPKLREVMPDTVSYVDLDASKKALVDEILGQWKGALSLDEHDSFFAVAQNLYQEIGGLAALQREPLVTSYLKYIDTQVNWDYETKKPFQAFLSVVLSAFNIVYMAAQADATIAYENATEPGKKGEYKQKRLNLLKYAKEVQENTIDLPSVIERRNMMVEDDHRNLVTNKRYKTFRYGDFRQFAGDYSYEKLAPASREIDAVPVVEDTPYFTVSDFMEMESRLPMVRAFAFSKVTNIKDELTTLNYDLPDMHRGSLNYKYYRELNLNMDSTDWFLAGDIRRSHVRDTGTEHVHNFLADQYNIVTDKVERSRVLYTAVSKYQWVPAYWRITTTLYPAVAINP